MSGETEKARPASMAHTADTPFLPDTTEPVLYVSQFCPQSQRAQIGLLEAGIQHKVQILPNNGTTLPKWLLAITPQGCLPVYQDKETVVINSDAIEVYLGKFPKITKLTPTKKKKYNPIMHCKTKLEPLVEQLKDTVNVHIAALLTKLFYHELETLENSLKGPFFLGAFSWVDIHYWTVLQHLPILEYLHGIQLPASMINIRQWMERLAKRESIAKTSVDTKALLYWFESLRGRGNIRPATSVIEFTQIINNALRRGIEELVVVAKAVDFQQPETTKTLAHKFKEFSIVLREQSRCKTEVIVKEFLIKGQEVPDTLHESFDKQKQILNILKTIIDKLVVHNTLLASLQSANEANGPETVLLEWKIAKLSKNTSKEMLLEQLISTLESFNQSLCTDLGEEERILSFERAEIIFSKRELYWLNRCVALLPRSSILEIYIPWVISNLMDPTQIRTFLLYYRFIMPFRFHQDIIRWLKLGLSDELWTDVVRQLDKVSKAESSMQNPNTIVRDPLRPPVPPRKGTTPSEVLLSPSMDTKAASDDQLVSSNPLIIFEMMSGVLKTKIRSIQDICTSNVSVMSLSTLEDALNTIFSFLVVKHQQDEHVIYPMLMEKSNVMHSLVNSYLFDKLEFESRMKNVITKLTQLRLTKEVTPEAMKDLTEEIFCTLSLELHTLYKQKQVYDLLYSMTKFEEQAYVIREILDQSPISYIDKSIPWIVRQMNQEKQVLFVMCMKKVLHPELFEKVMTPIRKVLPVSLATSLLSSHTKRKSM